MESVNRVVKTTEPLPIILAVSSAVQEPNELASFDQELKKLSQKLEAYKKKLAPGEKGFQAIPQELQAVTRKMLTKINNPLLTPDEKIKWASHLIIFNKQCREAGFWLNGFSYLETLLLINRLTTPKEKPEVWKKGEVTTANFNDVLTSNVLGMKKYFELPELKEFRDLCSQNVKLFFLVPDLEKYIPDLKAPSYVGTNEELSGTVILDTYHEGYQEPLPGWVLAGTLVKEAAMIEYFKNNYHSFKNYSDFFNRAEKYSYEKEMEFLEKNLQKNYNLTLTEIEQIKRQINFLVSKELPKFSKKEF